MNVTVVGAVPRAIAFPLLLLLLLSPLPGCHRGFKESGSFEPTERASITCSSKDGKATCKCVKKCVRRETDCACED